ncbi:MAG: glycosyltransferase, partial [Microthrixaceae bacterium]
MSGADLSPGGSGAGGSGAGETSRRVPAFFADSSVRRCGSGRRFLLGGSPIRLFSLTPAGVELFDRIELKHAFYASAAECSLIGRWLDAGVIHPQADPTAGIDSETAVDGQLTVALVIPVRDRAAAVMQLLASVAADNSPERSAISEIIVVDDGSAKPLEVQSASELLPPIRVIRREESGGAGLARNLGLAQVKADLVAFVDSDCTVTVGWLDPLLAHFANPAVVAVGPRVTAAPPPVLAAAAVSAV